jgi:ORF6N domain
VGKAKRTGAVPVEQISQSILVFRGHKVLLDEDLAVLYGVATRVLLQAVRRNRERFPEDFMIQLTAAEWAVLRSQSVILKTGRGQHRKYLPYAFTEQGVAMLSSVLNSKHAIAINIEIMRAFVKPPFLPSPHKRHLCRHHCHEQHVDVEWQAGHVDDRVGYVFHVEGRFWLEGHVGLQGAVGYGRCERCCGVTDVDLAAGDVVLAAFE